MTRFTFDARCFGWTVALLLVSLWGVHAPPLHSQQAGQAERDAKAAADDDDNDREVRRLPAFYREVVAPYQREKIYDIQGKYEDQIRVLQQQIKALLAQSDAEIEAVLVPEQREMLKKLKAEAAQRARELATVRKAAQPAPEAAPPETATRETANSETATPENATPKN